MNIAAFEMLAEKQIPAPVRRRAAAAEKRAQKRLAKALDEQKGQSRHCHLWRRERRQDVLCGPHGGAARELFDQLAKLNFADAIELNNVIEQAPWRDADSETKFEVGLAVATAIVELRVASGLPEFDDPLPECMK